MSDNLRVATAAPLVAVEVDRSAPGTVRRTRLGTPYRLDIYPGTHTAITLKNVPSDFEIVSNNLNPVDSNDPHTWLEVKSGTERKIFFFAVPDRKTPDSTLFVRKGASSGERALFLCRVMPLSTSQPLTVELKGEVVQLFAFDPQMKVALYNINRTVKVPPGQPLAAYLDQAVANGTVDHLVVNAHGGSRKDGAYVLIGDHITRGTVWLWDRLAGKVRYIWFQNCKVGDDNELMLEIARRTGAWVSAPIVGLKEFVGKKNQIDVAFGVHKHFNTRIPPEHGEDGSGIRNRTTFFRHARRKLAPNLETAMNFLIVSDPE
jgi:hypothetical protein